MFHTLSTMPMESSLPNVCTSYKRLASVHLQYAKNGGGRFCQVERSGSFVAALFMGMNQPSSYQLPWLSMCLGRRLGFHSLANFCTLFHHLCYLSNWSWGGLLPWNFHTKKPQGPLKGQSHLHNWAWVPRLSSAFAAYQQQGLGGSLGRAHVLVSVW